MTNLKIFQQTILLIEMNHLTIKKYLQFFKQQFADFHPYYSFYQNIHNDKKK